MVFALLAATRASSSLVFISIYIRLLEGKQTTLEDDTVKAHCLLEGTLSLPWLLFLDVLMLSVACFYRILDWSSTLISLPILFLLSPALKTLTQSTTSDTIWPLSGMLLLVSCVLIDPQPVSKEETSSRFAFL
jgi:hypothetical protein